ncbi:MAG: Gfo/Idh/MocA family oxidoreductase [Verrucomicrobiaceae bacterium]|nr:Gfo/Idh/MocA family oxidoreductase [Verrucomicrobiaceae bacterium]
MSSRKRKKSASEFDRRNFIRTAAGTAAAAGAFIGSASGEGIDPSKKIKVGFIGTGGRGTGAAKQALSADDNIVLHAVGDVFQEKINGSLETLGKDKALTDKIDVPSERQFVGLDSYQRVLDSGVDVVLLTTTPGFRPLHLRAAVEAGKHVFAEKPMAVDAAGVRHCNETLKMAAEKPLSIVAGFCWRYSVSRREAYQKVMEEGLIGDVVSVYATYYSNHSKPHLDPSLRMDGVSDVEWQIRNWYNYTWLGGGGLVEQAVHSVDKIGWVMGDTSPIRCRATGGLAAPQAGGNIYDHYHLAFEYPNNVWCHLASRKSPGCFNENADYVRGTKGTLVLGRGGDPYIEDNDGKVLWRYRKPRSGEPNMYQIEHDELFQSIRTGKYVNDGERMMNSTMMAIMGRMSCQTGKEVTWEEAMGANEDLFPNEKSLQWDQSYEPAPVAVPGVTQIEGIGGVAKKA